MAENISNFVLDKNGDPTYCFWDNCILSGGPITGLPTLSCLSGFDFSCEKCKCVPDGTLNNKPLSSFGYGLPPTWQFAVSWEMHDKEVLKDIDLGTTAEEISARSLQYSTVDSYAALAIARFDSRRKNYKVDIVPGTIVNAVSAEPWGDKKVFEGLRIATDVFYNQEYFEILHSSQAGGAINTDIEYIKFWFDGEVPEQLVDREYSVLSYHLCDPWKDDASTPLDDQVACTAYANAWLRYKAKAYDFMVRGRQRSGYGVVESPMTRTDPVIFEDGSLFDSTTATSGTTLEAYISDSLIFHGWNSTAHDDGVNALTNSIKLFTTDKAAAVKTYRNLPMDDGVVKFSDGIVRRDSYGRFITSIARDSYRRKYPFAEGKTKFVINGDPYLQQTIDEDVAQALSPGGELSSFGPGYTVDRDKAWNDSVRIPKTVWTEIDTLWSPVYTVLSSISSSYWPVSALSGTVTEAYIDHLNLLYPDEIPAGEVIEPAYAYLVLSSYPALSSHMRINTLSAAEANPWWNPSFLTHVSFVSGGKIGSRNVISLAYNKIDLNEGADIGNTTLLTHGDTLIEVNNAYNGAVMGLVLEDYEVEPFTVDINNPEIVLEPGYVSGVTDGAKAARQLGLI